MANIMGFIIAATSSTKSDIPENVIVRNSDKGAQERLSKAFFTCTPPKQHWPLPPVHWPGTGKDLSLP